MKRMVKFWITLTAILILMILQPKAKAQTHKLNFGLQQRANTLHCKQAHHFLGLFQRHLPNRLHHSRQQLSRLRLKPLR